MTVLGVGTDLVIVPRIENILTNYGTRFVAKILIGSEIEEFNKIRKESQALFLAKRFAAKEAVVKALGTGFRGGISMLQIQISHDQLGKPLVCLVGKAKIMQDQLGISKFHLSLSDDVGVALAFVVAV